MDSVDRPKKKKSVTFVIGNRTDKKNLLDKSSNLSAIIRKLEKKQHKVAIAGEDIETGSVEIEAIKQQLESDVLVVLVSPDLYADETLDQVLEIDFSKPEQRIVYVYWRPTVTEDHITRQLIPSSTTALNEMPEKGAKGSIDSGWMDVEKNLMDIVGKPFRRFNHRGPTATYSTLTKVDFDEKELKPLLINIMRILTDIGFTERQSEFLNLLGISIRDFNFMCREVELPELDLLDHHEDKAYIDQLKEKVLLDSRFDKPLQEVLALMEQSKDPQKTLKKLGIAKTKYNLLANFLALKKKNPSKQ